MVGQTDLTGAIQLIGLIALSFPFVGLLAIGVIYLRQFVNSRHHPKPATLEPQREVWPKGRYFNYPPKPKRKD